MNQKLNENKFFENVDLGKGLRPVPSETERPKEEKKEEKKDWTQGSMIPPRPTNW